MKVFDRYLSGVSTLKISLAILVFLLVGCGSDGNSNEIDNSGVVRPTGPGEENDEDNEEDPDEDIDEDIEQVGTQLDEIGDGNGGVVIEGENCDWNSANDGWVDNCTIYDDSMAPGEGYRRSLYTMGIQRLVYCLGDIDTEKSIEEFSDGIFGPVTTEAVIALQERINVVADGKVGENTWGAFEDLLDAPKVYNEEFASYSIRALECDDLTAQFYQRRSSDYDWKMARTPGSGSMINFSTECDPQVIQGCE